MFKAASKERISSALHRVAEDVAHGRVTPSEASDMLRNVRMALSQTAQQAIEAMGPMQANSREEVMKGFKSANPDLSKEQLEEIADQWEKNKDVVKDKHAAFAEGVSREVFVKTLFSSANEMFKARGSVRPTWDLLHSAAEGYIARIGPLAQAHGLEKIAKEAGDALYRWDQETGSVANTLEHLARQVSKLPKA